MYSFDHDLGHFVSIGPASVSRDGLVIVADEGVGIVKAGWHCGGSPAPGGAPNHRPPCTSCNGSTCVPGCSGLAGSALEAKLVSGCTSPACGSCQVNCTCSSPGDKIELDLVDGRGNGLKTAEVELTNGSAEVQFEVAEILPRDTNCPTPLEAHWTFGDGEEADGMSVSHTYTEVGSYLARVSVKCPQCPSAVAGSTVWVKVWETRIGLELVGPVSISQDGQ